MADSEAEIITRRENRIGRIRLNRPKALNSLTLGMIRAMSETLAAFAQDDAVTLVLVDGAGERGFCAGGDIRALHESGKNSDGQAGIFFREEYALDAAIATYPKPYIAFMDGITMGGGVGISAHGAHRVVTERTKLAMPETGIGFFPDVGGTWLLARAPGEIGTYLGLTGATIGAADAIYGGLADVFVASASLPEIAAALASLPAAAGNDEIRKLLAGFAEPVEAPLAEHRALIDTTMAFGTIPEILNALKADGSGFAAATLATLAAKSPTSLAVTLRLLRLGRVSDNLQTCLGREFYAASRVLQGHDFYEGVRAAVIDKDRNPQWNPSRIEDVSEADVREYLS